MSERARARERLSAAAAAWPLLVLLVLCWPLGAFPLLSAWYSSGVLATDPYPHLAGAAFVSLAALVPALALLAGARQAPLQGFPLLLAAWGCGLAALALAWPSDTFAARAALVLAAAGITLVLAGARLEDVERRRLALALALVSTLLTSRALWGALREPADFAGVLGNSGPLSQAALPGALCGAFLAARSRGTLGRALGTAAVILFALHAGLAPVLAGALSFAAASFAGALLGRGATARERALLAAAGALVLAAALLPRAFPRAQAPAGPSTGDLGGIAVRALLWQRVPALLAEHPLGVGPGQLQACFPPYRDARERRLSDGERAGGIASEVEHLHCDPLQGLAELGLLGGGAWILFLLVAARASLRGLGGADPTSACLALALSGLLLNALVHTPLSVQPTSALIGFLLLGAVLARGEPNAAASGWRALAQRWTPALTLVLAVGAVPLVRQGAALGAYVDAARRIDARLAELAGAAPDPSDAVLRAAAQDARAALERALAAAPDALPALILWARQAHDAERIAAWEAVLERRPHHWEALVALARSLAQAGEERRAQELAERARRLAPER